MAHKSTIPVLEFSIVFSALLICTTASAQIYYVKVGGNNTLDGTTPAKAWETIDRVNQGNVTYTTGTKILFKSGQTFRGSIQLSGCTGITLGTYPETPNTPPAIIKGSSQLPSNSWTLQGNIYHYDFDPATKPAYISHLYKDGQLLQLARYPNVSTSDSGWLYNDVSEDDHIQDAALPSRPAGYWTGAWAVIRSANWQLEMREVQASTDGDLTIRNYNGPLKLQGISWGYYLVNKLEELDTPGEWFYDSNAGRLFVMTTINANTVIEASVQDVGFQPNNCVSTVNNLQFSHYRVAGIYPYGTTGASNVLTVNNCFFSDLMQGILDNADYHGLANRQVSNSTFQRNYLYGLRGDWSYGKIENCTFKEIAMLPGAGGLPQASALPPTLPPPGNEYGSYSAIVLNGTNNTISGNNIETIGNNAIAFRGVSSKASNNYVSNAISLLNDGAGITFDNCNGCMVLNNIVVASHGNLSGAATNSGNYDQKAFGIYFGNTDIKNTKVQNNTISDCGIGILVDHRYQGFTGNKVLNNTVFNCAKSQIAVQDLGQHGTDYQASFTTIFAGNILYCLNSKQACLTEDQTKAISYNGVNPFVKFGTYDYNYYFNPFNDAIIFQHGHYHTSPIDYVPPLGADFNIPWTLAGWQARSGMQDANSSTSPLHLKDWQALSYSPINATLSTDLEQQYAQLEWNQCGTPTPQWMPQGTGHYVRNKECVFPQRDCNNCTISTALADQGWYSFKFRMRSGYATGMQQAPIFNPITKYERQNMFGVTNQWKNYELLGDANNMTSAIPGNTGDLLLTAFQDVQFAAGAQTHSLIDIDDVQVAKVALDETYHTQVIAKEHILRYNCPIASISTENVGSAVFYPGVAGEVWVEVDGTPHNGNAPLSLGPWQSMLLYRDNNLLATANQCPVEGGETVYRAREMYHKIDASYVFDDTQFCQPHDSLVKNLKSGAENTVRVMPNPARDEAVLVLTQPLDESGYFVLYNVVGAEVMRMEISADEQRLSFGTGTLPPGMYHYRVYIPTGMVGQGKWSIVR